MKDTNDLVRKKVMDLFTEAAKLPDGAKGASSGSRREAASKVGYRDSDFEKAPDEALLGIGCGNPVALASLKKGQSVLDLGSGCGFDAFLAANEVGPNGKVIGVDMNLDMLERARKTAQERHYANVEFRQGKIEELPVDSSSVEVVISNCVINLSPEKDRIYSEIMRVLKPGGKLYVSDLITSNPMPDWFLKVVGEVLGFSHWLLDRETYLSLIRTPGFVEVSILQEIKGGFLLSCKDPACDSIFQGVPQEHQSEIPLLAESILSIKVTAIKPPV